MSHDAARRAFRALLIVAGGAVLVWLVRSIGAGTITALLRRVRWTLPAVALVYLAHLSVRALALWRALPAARVPFHDVLRVRLAGEAVEMLTFTGPFLAEPAKGWLLERRGLDGPHAFGGVAIEYLLYTTVSAWMAMASLTILAARGALPEGLHAAVVGIVVGMAVFTLGLAAAAITGIGLIVPVLRAAGRVAGAARIEAAAARVDPIERVLVAFLHSRPARLAEVLAIEAAGHSLLAFEIWLLARALAAPFSVVDALIVEGAVKFISIAFFFVPGQIGASEGVYALVLRALGFPPAIGLTMALVRRVRGLLAAGVGVVAGSNL
jgi:lysylphosphatidylglycerol synthase-like protein